MTHTQNDGPEKIGRREWLRRVAGAVAGLAATSALAGQPEAGSEADPTAGITASEPAAAPPRRKRVSKVDAGQAVACVECDRCMPCGYGVDIPGNFRYYNGRLAADGIPDLKADRTSADFRAKAIGYLRGYDRSVPDRHQSQRCVKCFHCVAECPEGVFIVNELAALTALADELRDWECRYL